METITVRMARRLALARAGLLKPQWTGLPQKCGRGRTWRQRRIVHRIIKRFGYLQLDTVSVAGMRSHAIVLASRLGGMDPGLAEELLRPGEPLFEYWGHEASWIPLELYPVFAFRRKAFRTHPWWGDIISKHPKVAKDLIDRIRIDGPLRSMDMEGRGSRGWWDLKITKQVASALWSRGTLAIRERVNFQRVYDLTERVIPDDVRQNRVDRDSALRTLLLRALAGHGFASTGTLTQTWRLSKLGKQIQAALADLCASGAAVPCAVWTGKKTKVRGWIRPVDLQLAARLERARPRSDDGVLLSPFDPVLWDRSRVERLFDFHQILEIFKPASKRRYGYYCMPVLAGEHLVARVDLKADRKDGRLHVLSTRFEREVGHRPVMASTQRAVGSALHRYAQALDLKLVGTSLSSS